MCAAFAVAAWMLAGPAAGSASAEVPINNSPPEVAQEPGNRGQTPKVGEHIVCNPGSWVGGVSKFTYQWLREGIVVAEAEGQADNGLGGVYTITNADKGYELWCNVIATNGSGSEEEESENSIFVPGSGPPETPPENTGKPKVEYTGTAVELGTKLKCSQGTWTGSPTPTYSYEWLRDGARIERQMTNEYTVETADEGYSLSCKVTAENTAGNAQAVSNSVAVKAAKPVNEKAPEVLGLAPAEVGETLTCSPGKWHGNATFTYRWWREEPGKKPGEITGATGSTYQVAAGDRLDELSCTVRATNAEGIYTEVASGNKVLVRGSSPENTKAPEVSGTPAVGLKLTCKEGEWSGEPTPVFTYRWLLDGVPIESATKDTYTVVSEDRGQQLSCEVTATNEYGQLPVASAPVVVPAENGGKPPKMTEAPEIADQTQRAERNVGETIACLPGKWSGTEPIVETYQWMLEKAEIPSATGNTYEIVSADEGHNISCEVTATNDEGSAKAGTASIFVDGSAPDNIASPQISGPPEQAVGETLTCSPGIWIGTPTPTYVYEWLRSETVIPNAKGQSYVVGSEDRGYTLTCRVIAKNKPTLGAEVAIGATSENGVHVPGAEPANETEPEVEVRGRGTPAVGATLKCTEGKWTGAPKPTPSYQWLLDGREIPSATESTYKVVSADQGHSLACTVTEENVEGALTVKSKNSVSVPGVPLENLEPPSIEGAAVVGGTLTCERGSWEGKPPPSFTYEWLANGARVSYSISDTYTPEASEVGQTLSCVVIAKIGGESLEAASSNSVVISAAPSKPGPHQLVEQPAKKPAQSVDPYKTASVATAAEIRSGLSTQLTHVQHIARIASLLEHGHLSFRFAALGAGKLEVFWYEVPKGAHVAFAEAKPKPILVASATESYASASTKTVTLHLTKTGRRLLAHRTRITLTAEGVFVRSGASTVHWYKTFVLVH
jgi:hypothetical protein